MLRTKYRVEQIFIIIILIIYTTGSIFLFGLSSSPDDKNAWITASFLLISGLYFLYIFFRRSPFILFGDRQLTIISLIRKQQYNYSEISTIQYHSQQEYEILFLGYQYEAMKIDLNNDKSIILWDIMYSNMKDIRSFIADKTNILPPDNAHLKNQGLFLTEQEYRGNPYTALNTLLITGMTIFFLIMLKERIADVKFLLFLLPFFTVMYVFIAFDMPYFKIENELLKIKMHYFPFYTKEIELSEIKEFAIESQYRRSNALRIICSDFSSKKYGAGSLREKHWKKLIEDFKEMGISVRVNALL